MWSSFKQLFHYSSLEVLPRAAGIVRILFRYLTLCLMIIVAWNQAQPSKRDPTADSKLPHLAIFPRIFSL
jgi:hypothetical protein